MVASSIAPQFRHFQINASSKASAHHSSTMSPRHLRHSMVAPPCSAGRETPAMGIRPVSRKSLATQDERGIKGGLEFSNTGRVLNRGLRAPIWGTPPPSDEGWERGGWPFAPVPPGATLPDFTRWKPSEIPSKTRSVSAFLPGKVSVGRTVRRIRSTTSVRAAESVRRPGLGPAPPAKSALGHSTPSWFRSRAHPFQPRRPPITHTGSGRAKKGAGVTSVSGRSPRCGG